MTQIRSSPERSRTPGSRRVKSSRRLDGKGRAGVPRRGPGEVRHHHGRHRRRTARRRADRVVPRQHVLHLWGEQERLHRTLLHTRELRPERVRDAEQPAGRPREENRPSQVQCQLRRRSLRFQSVAGYDPLFRGQTLAPPVKCPIMERSSLRNPSRWLDLRRRG